MAKQPDRRQFARLTIPSQLGSLGPEGQEVRLVDLSPKGARVEHPDRLNVGLMCLVDLPPALGRGSLNGRIVWTKLHRNEQTLEGKRQHYYRSGLAWIGLTPTQQDAVAAALKRLKATHEVPPPEHPLGPPGEAPGETGGGAKGRA